MEALGASDLHLTAGSPPVVRVHGELEPIDGLCRRSRRRRRRSSSTGSSPPSSRSGSRSSARSTSPTPSPGVARFRVNIFFQRDALGAAFRLIPHKISSLEELGCPPVLHELAERPRGLVLVTGPTGSGKSTTLAAMIDEINRTRAAPHPHDRGSDRVPPRAPALPRQPARDRHRRPRIRRGAAGRRSARTRT